MQQIERAILVRFLAALYNGDDYSFDLTELRGLDTKLTNACLDYLNYDRWASASCTITSPGTIGSCNPGSMSTASRPGFNSTARTSRRRGCSPS